MEESIKPKQVVIKHADSNQLKVDTPPYQSKDEMDQLAIAWIDIVIGQQMSPRPLENKTAN